MTLCHAIYLVIFAVSTCKANGHAGFERLDTTANSKNHRFDNAGVLHASVLGSFAIANDAVPCNLSGDFCSVHMQSQRACGFREIGHYTTCKANGHAGCAGLDTTAAATPLATTCTCSLGSFSGSVNMGWPDAYPASSFGSFAIANDAVPCNLSGDFCSIRIQSQWACGFREIGHYTSALT
jgi:hypothetical protein